MLRITLALVLCLALGCLSDGPFGSTEVGDRPGGDLGKTTSAGTAVECSAQCWDNPSCGTWSWDSCGSKSCWHKAPLNQWQDPVSTNPCIWTGLVTAPRGSIKTTFATKVQLGDMPNSPSVGVAAWADSVDSCSRRCSVNDECTAFTYIFCNGMCYLKKGAPTNIVSNTCALSGTVTSRSPPIANPGIKRGDWYGNDIGSETACDENDCNNICINNAKCTAWTYSSCSNSCYLKSYTGTTVSDSTGCLTSGLIPDRTPYYDPTKNYRDFGIPWNAPIDGNLMYNPKPQYYQFQSVKTGCCIQRTVGSLQVGGALVTANCDKNNLGQLWSWGPDGGNVPETIIKNPDTFPDPQNTTDNGGALVMTADIKWSIGSQITMQHRQPSGWVNNQQIWNAAGWSSKTQRQTGFIIFLAGAILDQGQGLGLVEKLDKQGCGNEVVLLGFNPPPANVNVAWNQN